MPAVGQQSSLGCPMQWELHYSDRGRAGITAERVLAELDALAELIGPDRDLFRVFDSWHPPRFQQPGIDWANL